MSIIIARRVVRAIALPVVSAGILGGITLGLAGPASAAAAAPQPQPGIVATPQTRAQPATTAVPGYWWHRHHPNLLEPSAAANFIMPGA
jgi:hypothetical protein